MIGNGLVALGGNTVIGGSKDRLTSFRVFSQDLMKSEVTRWRITGYENAGCLESGFMIHLNADKDLCPCGSNKIIKDCCLRPKGILRPHHFVPKIPHPKTGLSNPRCYASELGNCSEKISGEHYVSHSILRELSDKGILEGVEGFPWLSEKKSLSTRSLQSMILCTRCNQALSGLDNIAKRFFLSIVSMYRDHQGEVDLNQNRIFLFNGHDIERWMLKTLCGFLYSGNAKNSDNTIIKNWKPNLQWMKILFARANFPNKYGLYLSGELGDQQVMNNKLGFRMYPLSSDSLGVIGIEIQLYGLKFILIMANPPNNKVWTNLEKHIYRPDELLFKYTRTDDLIKFGWDKRGQGGCIVRNVIKKP